MFSYLFFVDMSQSTQEITHSLILVHSLIHSLTHSLTLLMFMKPSCSSDDDEESDTNSLGGLPAWEKLPELEETRSKRAALGARTRERKASKLVADSSQSSQSSVDEPAAPPPRATSRGRDVSDKRKSDDVSDDENG